MTKSADDAGIKDFAKGFGRFADNVLRGRNNKWILNSSIGVSALEVGVPTTIEHEIAGNVYLEEFPFDAGHMLLNNLDINRIGETGWKNAALNNEHPLFDFSPDSFTLFGLDFPDLWAQLHGATSTHRTPLYPENIAEKMGLPDLPYGDLAHFAHLAFAVYDIGRTFQDVWRSIGDYYEKNNTSPTKQGIGLAAHLGKTITSPEMLHTFAARATMLTAMGLLHHTLGPIVALGVGYLAAHLVHSFFGVLEHNKETIQKLDKVPLLRGIYNHTGIKEWAEKDIVAPNEASESEVVDPYQELELTPEREVRHAHGRGRIAHMQPSLDPT